MRYYGTHLDLSDFQLSLMVYMKKYIDQKELAHLEYHGIRGDTQECIFAITRMIHFGEMIESAKLLSFFSGNSGSHGFALTVQGTIRIIKSGFTSGYIGQGPSGLSTVLKILLRHDVPLNEYRVDKEFHDRLNASCLSRADVDFLETENPIRPHEFYNYIDGSFYLNSADKTLKDYFPASINFGLLDERLVDLSLIFFENSDSSINTAFRRLEDILRNRTALIDESGVRLFSKAFEGSASKLYWNDTNEGEHNGKANLFKSVFMAFRNRRAHQEVRSTSNEALREFMLINELYILESQAVERV